MENLTTGAVLKDKLTNIASDLISKVDHTVQNLGKTKPSEDAPITFKVVHRGGALVRSGYETTSAQVHQLSEGEIATVVEQAGRRVRIISPVEGWVSVETKDGVTIMRPTAIQRRGYKQEAFESHFESKFERLKAKQRQGGYEDDPRAESSWRKQREGSAEERFSERHRSSYDDFSDRRHDRRDPSDAYDHRGRRDDYDDRSRRDDTRYRHERDDRREDRREDRRDSGREDLPKDRREKPKVEDTGGFVPRLAAPGSRAGPAVIDAPRPVTSSVPSGPGPSGPGSADLLSMDEPQAPAATSTSWDPFESGPAPAPVASSAAPWEAFGGQSQSSAPWDAFQSGSTPSTGSSAQAPFDPNAGCGARAGMAGGCMGCGGMGGSNPMMGAMGPNPMGSMGGCQNQMGGMGGMGAMGGGVGMANMGCMGSNMASMGMGGMPMSGGCQGGGMPGSNMGSMGMGMGMGGAGMSSGNPLGALCSLSANHLQGPATAPPGSKVEDLMSKTMAGVANLSLEQRQAQGSSQNRGTPMGLM